jgi:hypothetical protein
MAEDVLARLRRIQGLAAKLEVHHAQIDEMMSLMVQDGLTAMPYGQYGGSIPDPILKHPRIFEYKVQAGEAGLALAGVPQRVPPPWVAPAWCQ